jgi:drug/metabolite transporter (DMT)-like permease
MSTLRLFSWVALAMLAFAGNSLLCRMALKHTGIDAASFVSLRLVSGACMLWCVVQLQGGSRPEASRMTWGAGNWPSAAALFVYAAAFSFAYLAMSAATGALLLFGSVQATMIGYGVLRGERLRALQLIGLALALAGLVSLMLPGLAAPPWISALSMVSAGVAWGVYSLRGKRILASGSASPAQVTAGNFLRASPMALALSLALWSQGSLDLAGLGLAIASGALASGLGYAIWYHSLPELKATQAATVQLSVPVLAALGGVLLLGEAFTSTLALASCAILGGIALVIWDKKT